MGSDVGKGGIIGQILLVIINIAFILLGICALGVGAWAIYTGVTFSSLTGSTVIGGSALLIIVGIATAIIAGVGLFGALCKNRVLLSIYAIVVAVIVILEIVAGILAFVFRDSIFSFVEGRVMTIISNYDGQNPSSDEVLIVNTIQSTFSCCGFNNANDWSMWNPTAITNNMQQPPFCLNCNVGESANCASFNYTIIGSIVNVTTFFNTTDAGCRTFYNSLLSPTLLGYAIGVGVVGIIFGLFEIIGIVVSLILCCCISSANEQTVV